MYQQQRGARNDVWGLLQALAPSMNLRQSQLVACGCFRYPSLWANGLCKLGRETVTSIEEHVDVRLPGTVGEIDRNRFSLETMQWLLPSVATIELRIERDRNGTEMLQSVLEELAHREARTAMAAAEADEQYSWELWELSHTSWGASLVEAGLQRFPQPDRWPPVWPIGPDNRHLLPTGSWDNGPVPGFVWTGQSKDEPAGPWREAYFSWISRWRQYVFGPGPAAAWTAGRRAFEDYAAHVLLDVCGDLLTPVDFDFAWRDAARQLAQEIYDRRDFRRMADLAYFLQKAGCQEDLVVSHCRSARSHFRGCWVLDGLLGKT